MKRNVIFGTVLAAAFSVGLAAQSTPAQPNPTAQTPQSSTPQSPTAAPMGGHDMKDMDAKGTTFTGCLQASDKSATTGNAAKADDFVLANVSGDAMGAGSQAGMGTTGTSGATVAPYKLSGGKKDELRGLVNSKVEITGKLEGAPSSGTSTTGASSGAGTTGSAMSTGSRAPDTKVAGKTLRIDSIRQIAPSCS